MVRRLAPMITPAHCVKIPGFDLVMAKLL